MPSILALKSCTFKPHGKSGSSPILQFYLRSLQTEAILFDLNKNIMSHTVSEAQLLEALQWRYATKAFDPKRKIPAATWATLQEALILSASSFGLQPYQFIVVNNSATRAKLLPHAWNQP